VHVEGPTGFFEACNVFYSRPAFEAARRFPEELYEELGEHFGEDTALGWAVRAAGGRHVFAPDAFVRHKVFPREARRHLAACWRARHFPRLLRLRPEARAALRLGLFLSRDTALFELALAGLTLAARRRSALLLAAPYLASLAHRTFDRPAPRPLARAAGLAVSDLALVGARWSGSVRPPSPVREVGGWGSAGNASALVPASRAVARNRSGNPPRCRAGLGASATGDRGGSPAPAR
jgi:hypothetical protein